MNIKNQLPRLNIESTEYKDFELPTLSELISQCLEDYMSIEYPTIDLATTSEVSLKRKVESILQKRLYHVGINRYVNEIFESELIAANSTKHAKLVRKIIKMTCNMTTKKLENLYSIVKTVVKLGSDKELFDFKTKESPPSVKTNNLELNENEFLCKSAKEKRFDDDNTSFSLMASNNDTSSSTFEISQSKKHLIKKITYQTNSIGSMIINFNNSMDDVMDESGMSNSHLPISENQNRSRPNNYNLSTSNNPQIQYNSNSVRSKQVVADKFLFDPISLHKILGTYLSQDDQADLK